MKPCFYTVDSRGNRWSVYCNRKIQEELKANTVNWYNFDSDDIYWDDNGVRYDIQINHEDRIVWFCD